MRHRLRELGSTAEASELRIGVPDEPVEGAVDLLGRREPVSRHDERGAPQRTGELVGLLEQIAALRVPELVDALAQLDEADHPAAPLLREVRAREERPSVGRAHDRHGPATLAGHGLRRLHVDVVDVGSLLAVDLHVHEAPFITDATSASSKLSWAMTWHQWQAE